MKTPIALLLLAAACATACTGDKSPASKPSASPNPTGARAQAAEVQHVDAKAAHDLLAKDAQLKVLDVRTPAEFAEGHIENAINVDFRNPDFEQQLGELDNNAEYLVHCRSGHRSTQSLPVLEKLGFKKIWHLDGGFASWQKAGLPVTK